MTFLLKLVVAALPALAGALPVRADSPPAPAESASRAPPAPAAAVPAPAADVALRYRAFVAGAPVGEADVSVAVADGRYRVEGDARSNGWLGSFADWRNRFSAEGTLAGPHKEPAAFVYHERDRKKARRVVVREGTLQVIKNGKRRPERQSPAGADVVSALFVQPSCDGDQVLHTGRHVYRLRQLERRDGGCRYRVTDDDDDTFEVAVALAEREGLVVPQKITVHAWLTGWIELVEPNAP